MLSKTAKVQITSKGRQQHSSDFFGLKKVLTAFLFTMFDTQSKHGLTLVGHYSSSSIILDVLDETMLYNELLYCNISLSSY